MKTPVRIKQADGSRRFIGHIDKDIFYKKVKKSKHLWKKGCAWGVDEEAFRKLIAPQVKFILVYDEENRVSYIASVRRFKRLGFVRHFHPYRSQIFLSLRYWRTSKEGFGLEDHIIRTSKKELIRARG